MKQTRKGKKMVADMQTRKPIPADGRIIKVTKKFLDNLPGPRKPYKPNPNRKAVGIVTTNKLAALKEKPDPQKIVGILISTTRQQQELSEYALAKNAGVQIAQLQSIESSKSSYTFSSLIKVCKALGIKNIPITY